MERAQYTVTIDIINTGIINTQIRLKQGDSGTPLYIKVENNGNPYYDPDVLPQVYFQRPDRSTVLGVAQAGSDNKYLYIFKGNELEISGNVLADVKFKYASGRESTSTFKFECVSDTIGKTAENSQLIWNDVVETIEKVENMLADSNKVIAEMTEQATSASSSATAAAASQKMAEENAEAAAANAEAAANSADDAINACRDAETYAADCSNKAVSAETAAKTATECEQNAMGYMDAAAASAEAAAKSEANAGYYAEQAISISESLSGALRPKGTIMFSQLDIESAEESDMYNISDSFITTDLFKEGAGHIIPAGSNVYKTADGLWDILAGSPVSGIKGKNEEVYRTGNVEITPENIGLGNVDNTSDADKPISYAQQKEFDKINSNLVWKHLGNVKGSAALSLPDECNELYIECAIGGGGGTVGFQIPKIALSDTAKAYSGGRYDSASSYVSVAIALSKSEVYLSTCLNGSSNGIINFLDTSILKVYYR